MAPQRIPQLCSIGPRARQVDELREWFRVYKTAEGGRKNQCAPAHAPAHDTCNHICNHICNETCNHICNPHL
jgi:hypothetical protein